MDSTDESTTLQSGSAYDVIVVGGRAAGAATAMLLARRALRTLLINESQLGADTLSTHALMRGGVFQLCRWGLLDEIVAAGTPPVRRTTFRFGDDQVVISIKPSYAGDALYAPRRNVLDPVLVRAAADAGADVHHRTSATDIITRDGRAAGVRASTPDGRAVELHAPLVIGADGVDSTVAARVGATFSRVAEHSAAMTYAYWSDLATDGYEWLFHRNGCAGVIPTNDGQACVFVSASPERIGGGGIAVIRDLVADVAPELAERLRKASPPRAPRTWRGHRGYVRHSFGPGWALVGDAGFFTDPVGAHGLTDALRDAELLARAVADGIGDDRSMHEALEHYERTRDRLGIPLFEVVDRIAGHDWDDAEIAQLQLRLSSAMADEVEALAALDQEAVP